MPGPGHGAAPGDRVVDRVQAGGADDRRRLGLRRRLSSSVEPADQVVEVGEELVGRQVEVGEGVHGGAQPAHGGRGVDAVADDVADDQGDPGAGQRDDVEPVAADAVPDVGGQIAGGDLDGACRRAAPAAAGCAAGSRAVACSRV